MNRTVCGIKFIPESSLNDLNLLYTRYIVSLENNFARIKLFRLNQRSPGFIVFITPETHISKTVAIHLSDR